MARFTIVLYDKWSRKLLSEANCPEMWAGMSSWGGMAIFNGQGETIGGGAFGRNGRVDLDFKDEIGFAPYSFECSGYLLDTTGGRITLGHNILYFDVYSVVALSFNSSVYGSKVPIGNEYFGGPITVDMQAKDTHGNQLVTVSEGAFIQFDRVKPGKYTVKITGPFFGADAKYEVVDVPLMQSHATKTIEFWYPPPSPPLALQTCKRYAEVIEDSSGTMVFKGKAYKFVGFLEEFAITTHQSPDEQITYKYGGQKVKYSGNEYTFLASGVTNKSAAGGYGDYKTDTSRTIKPLITSENFVHFYYVKHAKNPEPLPPEVQLAQVSRPVWAGNAITWKDVEGAESYMVRLYNANKEQLYSKIVKKGVQRHDFTDEIKNYLPPGEYTCTVQALPEVEE